jgi:hypothetical protein
VNNTRFNSICRPAANASPATARRRAPAPSTSPAARPVVPLLGLVGLVAALAAAGGLLAAQLFVQGATGGHHAGALASTLVVGQDFPTSFGTGRVAHVEKIAGLTAKELAGVTHGIQNLVPPDKVQVEASVMLTNRLDQPVAYSLVEQFRLVTDSGGQTEHLPGLTPQPSRLPPHASITANVRFMAPRDGGNLWLAFSDPGRSEPILVALGPTDQAPEGVLDGYHEHGGDAGGKTASDREGVRDTTREGP